MPLSLMRLGSAFALTTLSGVLYALAFPLVGWWPLAWVALVPFLVAVGAGGARRAPCSTPGRSRPRPAARYAACTPARYPRWAAQTLFKDGAAHFFDSPVDLFAFLQKVERHDRRYTRNDIAISYVSDYATGKWIEDRHALFVHGSRVHGPMRDADLPAFASRKAADAMSREHGGKVLTFAEVTPELIRSLNRNLHHRH